MNKGLFVHIIAFLFTWFGYVFLIGTDEPTAENKIIAVLSFIVLQVICIPINDTQNFYKEKI